MRFILLAALTVTACRGSGGGSGAGSQTSGTTTQAAPPPESEAPVALNPDVPIAYPPSLFEQKVEGDVTLRLFVDSTGKLVPESTRVAEPSGYPALDSAALAGSRALRFAPAKRHGVPVATAFLQPIEFRQVGTTRAGAVTVPPVSPQAVAPLPPPPPPPVRRSRPRPVRPDTTRADTTRAHRDTTRVRADTTPPRPDTTKARPDSEPTSTH